MKTLQGYLLRQVMQTLLMTVAVFTFLLLIASVLKEVLPMLLNRQISLLLVLQAVALLVPFLLVFALPMGMLTAALLVFGRLSADHELTAVRASGVSLLSLVTPVLLLSVLLSGVAAVINMEIAPRARLAYHDLVYKIDLSRGADFLPEKTYIKYLRGAIVYVNKVRGTNLEDVLIYSLNEDNVESYNRAETGTVSLNPTNNVLSVLLSNVTIVRYQENQRLPPRPTLNSTVEFLYTNVAPRAKRLDNSDMTFEQLQDEVRALEKRTQSPPQLEDQAGARGRERLRQMARQRRVDLTLPLRVQMHRQVAFSFACIGFTLVGIPLGIRAHRRETTFGIAVALLLVTLYYSLFIMGQSLDTHPELAPHLILWLPNFIFQAIGAVLLWRANRGF